MSRSSTCERGQTEPLAALVAVAALSVGLALYGGALEAVLPGTAERDIADPTLDRVWAQIGSDGVYDPAGRPLTDRIDAGSMPDGYAVRVAVTRPKAGTTARQTVDEALVTRGDAGSTTDGPPASAESVRRPIPVVSGDGSVDTGTLRVMVW